MAALPIDSFLEIFDELYIGSYGKSFTWVIDRDPGQGFIDVIKAISAEDASRPLNQSGSTIAAHTEHLRWSLNYALTFFEGKQERRDWNESWKVKAVTTEEWKNLQSTLLNEYIAVRTAVLEATNLDNPQFLTGVMALLPHAAYHLGAIKQMVLMLKE
ncbi:hypothetical protein EOD41_20235 [Mucilaginibacter limnophilus]|uniref:DinB family protein n=1 Tax=Mucilaginibacter limnophilus TaxID=1932778 RepID=A0A3S2VJW2_9SPHI|nr:hypothetical protein [Mucilaginibacter limnophilus]RVT96498.1 hypothetical protein EOD41_20235 [Mucilaginibacter limnophilus]